MSDTDLVREAEARLAGQSRSALEQARVEGRLDRLMAATTENVLAGRGASTLQASHTWRKLGGAGLAGLIALSGAGYVATRDHDPHPPVAMRGATAREEVETEPASPSAVAPEGVTANAASPLAESVPVPSADVVAVEALPAALPAGAFPFEGGPRAPSGPKATLPSPAPKTAVREPGTPTAPTAVAPPLAEESAASLFRRANAARHGGDDGLAEELYRQLLGTHPETREAATARVIFARMRLERGDAREALAQFDAYLARSPNATLAEQALVGRAHCLRALGRRDDERAAWAAVLTRFPESASKPEALERSR
jgi:TolA-binding protein